MDQIDKINEFVYTESSLQCCKCKKTTTYHMIDSYDAAEKLVNTGWKVIRGGPRCPECQKK